MRSFGYRLLWVCADLLQSTSNGCLYLAAGLLRRDDLRAASLARWAHFCTSVDEVDAGLDAWERRIYRDVLRPSDHVLLVGCGTGRDLLALRELGYDVTGLEQVPELVEMARRHLLRRGLTATVLEGFVESLNLDERYDAVVFSDGCYSSLPRSASRIATLTRVKTRLSPEGRVVVAYRGFSGQSRLSRLLTRISAGLVRADWRPEPGDTFSRDHLARRILRYEHRFRAGEFAGECAAAGLRVLRDEEVVAPVRCAVAVP